MVYPFQREAPLCDLGERILAFCRMLCYHSSHHIRVISALDTRILISLLSCRHSSRNSTQQPHFAPVEPPAASFW